MPLPLSDISQAHRSDPERTEQALTKVGTEGITNHNYVFSCYHVVKIIVFANFKGLNIF